MNGNEDPSQVIRVAVPLTELLWLCDCEDFHFWQTVNMQGLTKAGAKVGACEKYSRKQT